jgi:hypothetical protein
MGGFFRIARWQETLPAAVSAVFFKSYIKRKRIKPICKKAAFSPAATGFHKSDCSAALRLFLQRVSPRNSEFRIEKAAFRRLFCALCTQITLTFSAFSAAASRKICSLMSPLPRWR